MATRKGTRKSTLGPVSVAECTVIRRLSLAATAAAILTAICRAVRTAVFVATPMAFPALDPSILLSLGFFRLV
ncbi:MAG TPA: hypothetical protein VMH22_13180 [bacterium]|nr:hypothetical protein [bacterium]